MEEKSSIPQKIMAVLFVLFMGSMVVCKTWQEGCIITWHPIHPIQEKPHD